MPILTLLKTHSFGADPQAPVNHGFVRGSVATAGTAVGSLALAGSAIGSVATAGTAVGTVEDQDRAEEDDH